MVVVGLGNPGPEYVFTRHNAGFLFVDHARERFGCSPFRGEHLYYVSSCERFHLVKPTTFMNLSGTAFPRIMKDLNATVEDLLVVVDDVSLPLGRIRIRKRGSDGGHNGLKSIINILQTKDFARMRIGIGPKPEGVSLKDFVLSEFTDEELRLLYRVLDMAVDALRVIIEDGIEKAMSLFNSKEVVG